MAKFATDCNILFTLLKIRGDCDLPSVDAIRKVHLNRCCLISRNRGDPGSRRFPIEYFYLNFCLFEHYLFHSSSRSKYIRLLYHWVSKAADCCFFFLETHLLNMKGNRLHLQFLAVALFCIWVWHVYIITINKLKCPNWFNWTRIIYIYAYAYAIYARNMQEPPSAFNKRMHSHEK